MKNYGDIMKINGVAVKPCNVINMIDAKNKMYQPSLFSFGKTVFFTKEEAEKDMIT